MAVLNSLQLERSKRASEADENIDKGSERDQRDLRKCDHLPTHLVAPGDNKVIIFPVRFEHQHFQAFCPTSAGQVLIDGDGVTTFGESITLKMKFDKSDAEKIASAFGIVQTSK